MFPYGSSTHLYDWDKSGQVLNSSHPIYDGSVRQWAADPVNLEHYYTYPASNQWSLDGSEGHATTLQQLIDLAKSTGKPFAIAETSAGNTHDGAGLTDNPTFVQWLADTLHQSGVKVSFVNVWNSNSGGEYHFTSSADHKPLEAAAWAKYFGDPPTSASAPATTESSLAPTLALTAIPKDPVPGTVTKAAPHTITVTDPQPATASTPTSPPQTIVTDPSIGTGSGHGWWGQHRNSTANGGTTTPATWTSTGLAGQSSALFSQIGDLVADRGVANSASAPINVANVPRANGSTASSLVNHTFALLNQYLASDTGRIDPGQIVAAGPNRAPWAQDSFLTRPQH